MTDLLIVLAVLGFFGLCDQRRHRLGIDGCHDNTVGR